jgi:hypothetical protein
MKFFGKQISLKSTLLLLIQAVEGKKMTVKFATLLVLLSAATCALAGEIRDGATMYVKADSMWFESYNGLNAWQRDKKALTPEDLKAHQDNLLGSRDAWQFTSKLPVRIHRYYAAGNAVEVEMLNPGRLHGSIWWVDENDCVK